MMTAPPSTVLAAEPPGPDPDLARVLAGSALTRSGSCTHPIRLTGTSTLLSPLTGEILHELDSTVLPGGVIAVPCGNRRSAVCPSCSLLYKYDAYQLIAAGLRGGKQVPATVAEHPQLFVTLAAPSFGPVHLGPAKNGARRPCSPRRTGVSCRVWHPAGDPLIGSPLEAASYDYVGHVMFNAHAGALWSRFTIETRRALADLVGMSRTELSRLVRVAFVKVAEYQACGIVHFHAIIRIDGRDGPTSTPPDWADLRLLEQAIRQAAARVRVRAPQTRPVGGRTMRWGRQLDTRPISAESVGLPDSHDHSGSLPGTVAARYIAKYATKGTETTGDDIPRIACRSCSGTGHTILDTGPGERRLPCDRCGGRGRTVTLADLDLTDHARKLIDTCWRLGGISALADLRLRQWAHTFGFRGHFATKSRAYSTTFAALRGERAAYTAARHTRRWCPR